MDFQRRVLEKKVVIGFFGLSPKGLEMAVKAASEGYKVICFDTRDFKRDMVRKGISFSDNVRDSDLRALVERGMISVSSDFSRISDLDILSVLIPVEYIDVPGIYDIEEMAGIVADNMKCGLIICLEDFDRTENLKLIMDKRLTSSGFRYNRDYVFGAYSLSS